jgi:hypothetical protein
VDLNDSDAFFQTASRAPIPARDNSRRVEALLPRMTLEEKIGQMTQLEIEMVTTGSRRHLKPAVNQQASTCSIACCCRRSKHTTGTLSACIGSFSSALDNFDVFIERQIG